MSGGYQPGEIVCAPWGDDGFLYPGVLVGGDGQKAHIAYLDGDETDVPWSAVSRVNLVPGMRLSVNWKGRRQYFNGTVTAVLGPALQMNYDDGDRGWTTVAQIRVPTR